jgi:hypothetical protein
MGGEKYMGKYYIPVFAKEVDLHFGVGLEFVEGIGYKDIETPPTDDEIKEYENTLKVFIENIDEIIESIKEEAFKYYKEVKTPYAMEFEKEYSLIIDNKEKHFELMKDLFGVTVYKDKKIELAISYEKIDTEHGLEILLKNNQVYRISDLGETFS